MSQRGCWWRGSSLVVIVCHRFSEEKECGQVLCCCWVADVYVVVPLCWGWTEKEVDAHTHTKSRVKTYCAFRLSVFSSIVTSHTHTSHHIQRHRCTSDRARRADTIMSGAFDLEGCVVVIVSVIQKTNESRESIILSVHILKFEQYFCVAAGT